MSKMSGVRKQAPSLLREAIPPTTREDHKAFSDERMLELLPCSVAYPDSDHPLPVDGPARELWNLSDHATVCRHLIDALDRRGRQN